MHARRKPAALKKTPSSGKRERERERERERRAPTRAESFPIDERERRTEKQIIIIIKVRSIEVRKYFFVVFFKSRRQSRVVFF